MLPVSNTYLSIVAGEYHTEWKASIGGIEYDGDTLVSARTQRQILNSDQIIGNCVCAQLDLAMLVPDVEPPRMAEVHLYIRVVSDETGAVSEWLPKGTYYISTRKEEVEKDGVDVLDIHCYDAMLKTENPAATDGEQDSWPKTDLQALQYIADKINVAIDDRTLELVNRKYLIPFPGYGDDGYSLRELLSYIASMYAGNALITDEGYLRILALTDIGPEEDGVLVDEFNSAIIFGDTAILVG